MFARMDVQVKAATCRLEAWKEDGAGLGWEKGMYLVKRIGAASDNETTSEGGSLSSCLPARSCCHHQGYKICHGHGTISPLVVCVINVFGKKHGPFTQLSNHQAGEI